MMINVTFVWGGTCTFLESKGGPIQESTLFHFIKGFSSVFLPVDPEIEQCSASNGHMCFVRKGICIWFADQLPKEVYSKEGAESQVWEKQKPAATHSRIQPVMKSSTIYCISPSTRLVMYLMYLWDRPFLVTKAKGGHPLICKLSLWVAWRILPKSYYKGIFRTQSMPTHFEINQIQKQFSNCFWLRSSD